MFLLYSQDDLSAISTAVDAPGHKEPDHKEPDPLQQEVDPKHLPREARVLVDIVTSRRTSRGEDGYMCIILHVRGVSLLTGWTHLHSVQKPSASQPLPLVMEKAEGKQARSASPSANLSTRQTRSTQKI